MILLAIVITFAVKLIFNPVLFQQQESIAKQFHLSNIEPIMNSRQLDLLVAYNLFDYIKVNNKTSSNPLVYEKPNRDIASYILPIEMSKITANDGSQSIEYRAANQLLLDLFKSILGVLYFTLAIAIINMHLNYNRLLKRIETSLVEEINDINSPQSILSKVSHSIRQQKTTFHRALQNKEQQISSLTHQVNTDTLTGFFNRYAFREALTAILSANGEIKHAILFFIRASELNTINATGGFQKGDQYIKDIAQIIAKVCNEIQHVNTYRLCGSDIAIIAENMTVVEAQRIATKLKVQFDHYQKLNQLDSVAYNGISAIVSGQLFEQALSRTDIALAKAQAEGVNCWAFQQNNTSEKEEGQQQWKIIIENIIANQSIMLLHQPIQPIQRNMKGYQQIFTRFIGENNNMIPTDTVFAMAQRVDMIIELENMIIETLINQCRHKADGNTRWGINLTSTAIQDSHFIVWLERLLLRESKIASCLIFEMREQILDVNLAASKRIFEMLKRTGTRSAICNFGKGIGSFRLFKELKPNYVKIDSGLISNIERDNTDQQFLRMIIDVSHRMNCYVIAEGVEHLEQKQTLESMYIDGVQGFLIARPSPL